jgi:hypothetical protein
MADYANERSAPNADDKAFGHNTPFDRVIKIRDGARFGVRRLVAAFESADKSAQSKITPLLTRGLLPQSDRDSGVPLGTEYL